MAALYLAETHLSSAYEFSELELCKKIFCFPNKSKNAKLKMQENES